MECRTIWNNIIDGFVLISGLPDGSVATMRREVLSADSGFFAEKNVVAVDRALSEFRAGRPVLLVGDGDRVIALPVEGLTAPRLAAFKELCGPAHPQLVITARRAQALGFSTLQPVALDIAGAEADTIFSLAADVGAPAVGDAAPTRAAAIAAIDLAKLALGLPAVLTAAAPPQRSDSPIVEIKADAIGSFRRGLIEGLRIAARADVPLHGSLSAQFVVFSDTLRGHPTAIIIGNPDPHRPVPVRLHSACLTGDVFGSRRCDCGDQLRLALANIEATGGGIILYLAQEGRGLGLVNKMRAYALQDAGLDTVDANTTLGFDDDERDYDIAARMLQILGYKDIVLLTNNPAKVDGLAEHGINICDRLSLVTPVNADNRRYLTAKATRAGHHLDHLMAALADSEH
jgi:GTP cyclohydrolase II